MSNTGNVRDIINNIFENERFQQTITDAINSSIIISGSSRSINSGSPSIYSPGPSNANINRPGLSNANINRPGLSNANINSPGPSNANINSPGPSNANSVNNTESGIRSELSRIFRPHGFQRNESNPRRHMHKIKMHKLFYKEIILLTDRSANKSLSGYSKVLAYKQGRIIVTKIDKLWTERTIRQHFSQLFINHLKSEDGFDILLPMYRDLVKIPLPDGDELTGEKLNQIFRLKPVYIRPYRSITADNCDTDSTENIDDYTLYDEIYDDASSQVPCNSDVEMDLTTVQDQQEEEDEALKLAIENSLLENKERSLKDIPTLLTEVKEKFYNSEESSIINVIREDVLNCALRTLKRPLFSPFKMPNVMFTDNAGTSEGAIDTGGPLQEFFTLVLREIKNLELFEGPEYSKMISFRTDALQERLYFHIGCLMGMSLVYGGPAPRFFSKHLFNAFVGIANENTLEDVHCALLKSELEHVRDAEDISALNAILGTNVFLTAAGCPTAVLNLCKKVEILEGALNFYLDYRNRPAIQQLIEGFQITKVYDLIKENHVQFEELFCFSSKITAKDFNEIFNIIHFSTAGSTKRIKENRALAYFRDFLLDCEETLVDIKVQEILQFVTGLTEIPPLGFSTKPSIEFLHGSDIFPKSNTCGLILYLPTAHQTYEIFKDNFQFAIRGGMVFGFE